MGFVENDIDVLYDNHSFSRKEMGYLLAETKYLQKYCNAKIVVYGGGRYGRIVTKYIKENMLLDISSVIDINPGVDSICGVKVIKRDEYHADCPIIIFYATVAAFDEKQKKEIDQSFDSFHILRRYNLLPWIDRLVREPFYSSMIENREKIISIYNKMIDTESKKVIYEYVAAYLEGHSYRGGVEREDNKYFGVDDSGNRLFNLPNGFTWINLGAAKGDTLFFGFATGLPIKRVYAVEGDKNMLKRLRENLSLLTKEDMEKVEVLPYYCGSGENEISIDEIGKKNKVDLINMDIEGSEIQAIISGLITIKKHRPVLAVCAYHLPDDIIRIPDVIDENIDNYSYAMRKYPSACSREYYDQANGLNELVMYAIPNEKLYNGVIC